MEKDTAQTIHFFTEDISFQLEDENKIRSWILAVITAEKQAVENINYIFCSDEYLLEINKKHLNHDYYTDIISFPFSKDPIEGDIFISIDRIKDNAQNLEIEFTKELARVLVHGVLHFLGFGDKSSEEILIMRSKEDKYIDLLNTL